MRKWILALVLGNVVFAAATLYLWLERGHAPATGSHARVPASIAPTTPVAGPRIPANASDVMASAGVPLPAPGDPAERADDPDVRKAYVDKLLAIIRDPAEREKLLNAERQAVRQQFDWVDKRLKLTPKEHERLMELLALQSLEARQDLAECISDPGCDPRTAGEVGRERREQQRDQLLGPERARQFASYPQALAERETVMNLLAQLPDEAWFSSTTAASLTDALADESYQAQIDARESGRPIVGYGIEDGWLYYRQGGTTEEKLKSAEEYLQRMNTRAAQFLTDDQLAHYTEMQQRALAHLREQFAHEGESQTN